MDPRSKLKCGSRNAERKNSARGAAGAALRFPSSGFRFLSARKEASVLLITLGFILLITVITVAFLVRSQSSLQTSQSYAKEIVAREIGAIAINSLAAQFQREINAPGDLLLPDRRQVNEQNPRLSSLIRQTTDTHGIDTDAQARNGWTFNRSRWRAPALLTDAQYDAQARAALPQWVYVYAEPSAGTGTASDVIGRYAAMVYDVGGLLDINEAGVPRGVPIGDKGSVAFADLSAIPGGASLVDRGNLAEWRLGGNSSTAIRELYYGNSTVTDPTKAGILESPAAKVSSGRNRFFSRMELIKAAEAGQLGLNKAILPYFRTRSAAANRVSVEDLYAAGTRALVRLTDSSLTANADRTFTIDRIDGSRETYTIKAGQSLIQNRFPLARLRWLADREADGTPRHPEKIKKYFGLTWNSSDRIFIYTSPDGSDAARSIKTLREWAAQINGASAGSALIREPDFFEWLKAGINPDSLGQTGGSTWRQFGGSSGGPSLSVPWEVSKDLHVLRIGANIIDQSDPDGIPTGIRSRFSNVDPSPFDSFGQENLPGINEVIVAVHRPNNSQLDGYFQFELWNPNREAYSADRLPRGYDGQPIRRIRVGTTGGSVFMQPYVYMASTFQFPRSPLSGRESWNVAWGYYLLIALYSQGKHPLLPNPLAPTDFRPQNLTNRFVEIPLTGARFFSEPAVASATGPDFSNQVNNGYTGIASNQSWLYLGRPPSNGANAILFMTVMAQRSGIVGVPLSSTTNSTTDGIYVFGANITVTTTTNNTTTTITTNATTAPSGAKHFNAVTLHSLYGNYNGVRTAPVTLQIEVQPAGSAAWIPVNRYHNLALGLGQHDQEEGRISGILTGGVNRWDADDRQDQDRVEWPDNWPETEDTRDFSNWSDVGVRKGYLMSDPRTERFGLSDNNQATPGQGIYPLSRETNAPFSVFAGTGIVNNMPCGTVAAVGGNLRAGGGTWDAQGPAVSSPLAWQLFEPNIRMSPPAYLAWNEVGSSQANHSYRDYDGVARPGDARWVPRDRAHPAWPAVAQTASATWHLSGTPNADVLAARPTILDRPFRNVAELGSVFRDIPWKSLDLFSPDSADRRLLDIFSIEDRETVTGKINPNLADNATFQSLLRGASLDPSNAGASSVPVEEADAAAKVFSELPASDPIHNSANMAARLATHAATRPGGGYSPYKTRAENFIRALSSTTDTRSWQLMLDVVAQSGRIAPGGTMQDFIVDGQKRFFVYLTLDRITGEIVFKHLEPVYE